MSPARSADGQDMDCDHSGPYSGAARYMRKSGQLRLLLVCDECGAERAALGRIAYQPRGRRFLAHLAELTAGELGLDARAMARVRLAALVCDVGRDEIPAEVLNKRGPLTDAEWLEVRRQPELGAALLADTGFDDIREWILCHRERPDGGGYPRGLSGDQIPLEARVLAVCDAYTAMTSERPHRAARDHADACRELERCAGTQFDADVVVAFMRASRRRDRRLARVAA
jgi:HD-GYP domain-containing protein (c-di-GMP phosphodiesterase class II)